MKILIQRVTEAKVEVKEQVVGKIGKGVLVFVGITHQDTLSHVTWLSSKLAHLRIFEDENGKMNQSLLEQRAAALIVSQFTLYANCSYGRRPSFIDAAPPELANQLYLQFIEEVRKEGVPVETGIFGAQMKVSLTNDGPITMLIER